MLRLVQIIAVFVWHLVMYPLSPEMRKESFGVRLRRALETLGLVFIKIGQSLAARKFFDGDTQIELQKLWDNSKPLPFSVVKPIIEYGVTDGITRIPISQYFDSFEETPYASASIAQTHVAVLHGQKVIVKVRRPNVLRRVHQDMRILKTLLLLGSLVSKAVWCIRSARIPEQIEKWLLKEADLRNEAINILKIRQSYSTASFTTPDILFASADLLIESFLDGIPLNRWDEKYRRDGYDPQAAIRVFLAETFGPGFRGVVSAIHADPHPANLIVMKGGRIGLVDFGLIAEVSKQDIDKLNDGVFAVYAQDPNRTVKALLRMCGYTFPNKKRKKAFKRDVVAYVEECQRQSFSYWLIEMGRILMRHGVPAPEVFTLICRFGVLADGVAQMFFPGSSTLDLVGEEIKAGMRERMLERLRNIDVLPLLLALSEQLERAPITAAEIIRDPLGALTKGLEAVVVPFRSAA